MQNNKIFLAIFVFALLFSSISFAHEEDHEDIVLTEKSIKNYGIETIVLNQTSPYELPRNTAINSQDEYYIFKKEENNTFAQIEINPISINKEKIVFTSDDLSEKDEVVISGSKYLRIILLDQEGGEVGHAH